uniref:Secreted protein n=1 Tax=Mesocestoides corti TaxID=53468 RepID=A0A5K3G3I1_MESCO
KTGTTEQALLTNQNPEPRVRRLPSESTTLATPLIIYCISSMSFSGWLLTFSHAIGTQRDTGLAAARWSNMSAPYSVATSHASGAFHPSPLHWPRRSLFTAPHPCPALVGSLSSSHAIGTQRDTGLESARWSNMSVHVAVLLLLSL